MTIRIQTLAAAALSAAVLLAAPAQADERRPSAVDRLAAQSEAAAQAAARETVEPNEIKNIERRRVLMGKPGLVQYVVFLAKSGQPIDYFAIDGKCTSSEKRLTPGEKIVRLSAGDHYKSGVMKAASEDGTYGSSSPYIYCRTTDGRYKQWNGQYYVSDHPIELTIKPLVIDLSGKTQQQQ